MATPTTMPYQLKGYAVRGIVASLSSNGWTDAVQRAVGPEAAALLVSPPLPGSWVDGQLIEEISRAVMAQQGAAGVRKVQAESAMQGAMVVLRPIVESTLRLLGASPATILANLGRVSGAAVRGISHAWVAGGPHQGTLTTTVEGAVSPVFYEGTAGSVEGIYAVCGTTGNATVGQLRTVGGRTVGDVLCVWKPR